MFYQAFWTSPLSCRETTKLWIQWWQADGKRQLYVIVTHVVESSCVFISVRKA